MQVWRAGSQCIYTCSSLPGGRRVHCSQHQEEVNFQAVDLRYLNPACFWDQGRPKLRFQLLFLLGGLELQKKMKLDLNCSSLWRWIFPEGKCVFLPAKLWHERSVAWCCTNEGRERQIQPTAWQEENISGPIVDVIRWVEILFGFLPVLVIVHLSSPCMCFLLVHPVGKRDRCKKDSYKLPIHIL